MVPLAQPFRPFAKEILERQRYPVRHYTPGGEVIKPYEITSWSLPLYKGVDCREIRVRSKDLEEKLAIVGAPFRIGYERPAGAGAMILPASENGSYMAAFKAREKGLKVWRIEEAYPGLRSMPWHSPGSSGRKLRS